MKRINLNLGTVGINNISIGYTNKRSHYNKSGNPKIGYPTRKSAEIKIKKLRKMNEIKSYIIYKCLYRNKYHIATF